MPIDPLHLVEFQPPDLEDSGVIQPPNFDSPKVRFGSGHVASGGIQGLHHSENTFENIFDSISKHSAIITLKYNYTYSTQVLPSDLFGGFKWPLQRLSDLHLGNQKVTWKKLDYNFHARWFFSPDSKPQNGERWNFQPNILTVYLLQQVWGVLREQAEISQPSHDQSTGQPLPYVCTSTVVT